MPQIDLASWSSPSRAVWPSDAQQRGLSIATTAGMSGRCRASGCRRSSIQITRFGVTLPERRADPAGGQIGGSARVISVGVPHSASHLRRRHLWDDLGSSADRTGLPDALAAGQGKHSRQHGHVMPVPRQARPPCPTGVPKAGTATPEPAAHRTRRRIGSRVGPARVTFIA